MDKNLENDLTNIDALLEKVKNYSFDFLENMNKIPAFPDRNNIMCTLVKTTVRKFLVMNSFLELSCI